MTHGGQSLGARGLTDAAEFGFERGGMNVS